MVVAKKCHQVLKQQQHRGNHHFATKSHRNLWRTNPQCMAKYPPMQPPISRARKAMAATPSRRCSRSPCSLIYSTHVVPDAAANKANTEPGPCSSLCCPRTGGCSAALCPPFPCLTRNTLDFPFTSQTTPARGWEMVTASVGIPLQPPVWFLN